MVKHVIIWNLKEGYTAEEKEAIKKEIKESIESLNGKIPGLINVSVNVNPLPSSSGEVILDSSFENEEALKGYAIHPDHVEVANTKVRPFVASRACMDYEV